MNEASPPLIFDPALKARRLARALHHRGKADFIQHACDEIVLDNLADVNRQFTDAEVLGGETAHLAAELARAFPAMQLHRQDEIERAEEIPALEPESRSAILGSGGLHRVNDVPGLLAQCRRALKPDGLLMWVFAGGETLTELRQCLLEAEMQLTGGASTRVHPFIDVRDAGGLLQRAGFALPIVDKVTLTVTYEHLFALIRDLRWMGETNLLMRQRKTIPSRRLFSLAAERYREGFAEADGRIRATVELVTMIGWKPHASQPQPARRGSGQSSLTEALKS